MKKSIKFLALVLVAVREAELDTLEVKEVDFEKELDRIWFDNKLGNYFDNDALDFAHVRTICKHFFELGLKAVQNCNNSKCEDLRDDGICNYATTKLGRTMRCENISCSRRNKTQKG